MVTLIVTASSKSKCEELDENIDIKYSSKTFAGSISKEHREELISARKFVLEKMDIEEGPDINSEVEPDRDDYIPAYLRYTGRTYSQIDLDAWYNLAQSDDYDCVILTALYGIIRFDEPIRNYEIEQASKIPDVSTVKTFWKNEGAREWLMDYIKQNDIDEVKFVLSTSYAKIIQRDEMIKELEEMGIPAEDKQFAEHGRASMLERGKYISKLLTT